MTIDIERAWTIYPKDDPLNEAHPHRTLSVHVGELSGAVLLEIEVDGEDGHEAHVASLLTADEWRELTSLPVRFVDPEELAAE